MLLSYAKVRKKRCTAAAEWCTNRTMDVFQAHDYRDMFDKHPNDEDTLESWAKNRKHYFYAWLELHKSLHSTPTCIWEETTCDAPLKNSNIAMAWYQWHSDFIAAKLGQLFTQFVGSFEILIDDIMLTAPLLGSSSFNKACVHIQQCDKIAFGHFKITFFNSRLDLPLASYRFWEHILHLKHCNYTENFFGASHLNGIVQHSTHHRTNRQLG